MRYLFKSKIGTFSIEPDETHWDLVQLCMGGMWLGTYETPELAAKNVYNRNTGWPEWDKGTDEEAPRDLSGWEAL
jgi:hypothetical protein